MKKRNIAICMMLFSCAFVLTKTASSARVCTDISTNLSFGSSDKSANGQVMKLQNFLSSEGYLRAVPNGIFGPATKASLQKFQ
ncbi:MAG: peptidoglycan-binding domain-containing protein, partial [Candidatus Paceibacterota bacterium]